MYDNNIVLIPAYEPDEIIINIVKEMSQFGFTIIVVNDGSKSKFDNIFNTVSQFATVLTHENNLGKGAAIKTALKYIEEKYKTSGATIVTADADGQHCVNDVSEVCKISKSNPNTLILGCRCFNNDVPARSLVGNTITKFVYRLTTGKNVSDTQTGLRAFGTELIPFMLNIKGERYEYEMNVLLECARNDISIREVKIRTIYIDNNSNSHFNAFKDSLRIYKNIIKFAGSSLISFFIDFILYTILIFLTQGLGSVVSIPLFNILARVVSSSANFIINKKYIFKNNDNIIKKAAEYAVLAICILIGNTFLLSVFVETFGMNCFVAKILIDFAFFIISWAIQRFIIFNNKRKNLTCVGGNVSSYEE